MQSGPLSRRQVVALSAAVGSTIATNGVAQATPTTENSTTARPPLRDQALHFAQVREPNQPAPSDVTTPPLERDEQAWTAITDTFSTVYGTPSLNLTATPVKIHQRIEQSLAFTPIDRQSFRPNHVDILLNQAADLLDRCLVERDDWYGKASRAAALSLEVSEFLKNDEIHKEEVSAGIYTVNYAMSHAERLATIERINGSAQLSQNINGILTNWYSSDAINAATTASQRMAWANAAMSNFAADLTFNNQTMKGPQHVMAAAGLLAPRASIIEQLSFVTQQIDQASARRVAEATLQGLSTKADWDLADAGFKRKRTQVARDLADYKIRLATMAGGAYNYAEQMDSVLARFNRDYSDAIVRLDAAREGMKIYYGYDVAIPPSVVTVLSQTSPAASDQMRCVDDAVRWVRDAIAFLVSFTQLEQSYTYTLSLKQTLGEQAWQAGLSGGQWKARVNEDLFPRQSHVRVRGLNLFVEGKEGAGIWRTTISAPTDSFCRHLSGAMVPLKQDPPVLRIARAISRSSVHFPEVFGASILRNISPFGEWTIQLNDRSTKGVNRSEIGDVEIDIDIVVRGG